MKHFYFHFRMGNEILIDEEGELLPDYSSACRQAERSVSELLANAIKFRNDRIPDSLVIVDEQGLELGTVWFEAVLLSGTRR
ncbi:DUF6894 family protein [Bradyrhizobium sp. TZ2]